VLGYGGDAVVEGPPDVVAAFRARVEELARKYACSGPWSQRMRASAGDS
jgi:hypothetical protein